LRDNIPTPHHPHPVLRPLSSVTLGDMQIEKSIQLCRPVPLSGEACEQWSSVFVQGRIRPVLSESTMNKAYWRFRALSAVGPSWLVHFGDWASCRRGCSRDEQEKILVITRFSLLWLLVAPHRGKEHQMQFGVFLD
jgi:nitroimidazol reductase NimA-like FMN-containing flavoprotein (pyridoxamine 5'-phosphate oxidase superfamily)